MDEALKLKIKFIRRSIPELKYLSGLVELHKIGSIYSCLCPFHHEHTPSLRVYPKGYRSSDGKVQDYTSWYCFGCKKGGDIVKFEQLFYDLDTMQEACDSLQGKFHLTYNGDNQLNELKVALTEVKQTEIHTMSLLEINFICSISCRNYLKYVLEYFPNKFDEEFDYIQSIYKKLDYELLERNAIEAKILIDITNNSLKKRKNMLTN